MGIHPHKVLHQQEEKKEPSTEQSSVRFVSMILMGREKVAMNARLESQ